MKTLKKEYLVVGFSLITIGLIFIGVHNNSVFVQTFEVKDRYEAKVRESIEVRGYFEKGDHFYFNFTSGKYWGGEPLTELYEPSCDLGEAYLPEHKIVVFYVDTPSNETCLVEARLPYGIYTFAIIYANKSKDFTPLPGGNLTWSDVGIEGIINKEGNYAIRAVLITPPVYKTRVGEGEPLQIEDDPPQEMVLWVIRDVETKPYFILLPFGITLITCGVVLDLISARDRGKRARRLKYKRSKRHK